MDGLWVVQVTLLGDAAHDQMFAHHPLDGLAFLLVQAELRADPLGDPRPEDRVVPAAALGDVVEQHAHI